MVDPVFIDRFVIALVLGLIAVAAATDVAEYRIPNRVSAAIAALYPVHVLCVGGTDWPWALAVAATVLMGGFVLHLARAIGGGDVKLLAAVALWAGPAGVIEFLLATAVAGGVMAAVMATPLRFLVALASEAAGGAGVRDAVLGAKLPYGVAIAAGAMVALARAAGVS